MTALYLLSMLAHAYDIIVDREVGSPGHVIEVVDSLNDTDFFILMIMTTIQLNGAADYES